VTFPRRTAVQRDVVSDPTSNQEADRAPAAHARERTATRRSQHGRRRRGRQTGLENRARVTPGGSIPPPSSRRSAYPRAGYGRENGLPRCGPLGFAAWKMAALVRQTGC